MENAVKFEVEIKKEDLKKLDKFLADQDCELETDEEVVRELFWLLGNRGTTELDLRDKVKVKKII